MNKYWQNALTFDEYLQLSEQRAADGAEKNGEFQEYYELGLQRTQRTLKTFKIHPEQTEALKEKNFSGKLLIISEPWCGDASATVPAVAKFFEAAGNEVRIFLRDSDTSLIDQYLTNGTQSIPKVLVLDAADEVQAVWGPRPEYGNRLLQKFKDNPVTYSREQFYSDLQVYYAKNRGSDAIEEIIALL